MMGQELFEHPMSQYPIYNVAVLDGARRSRVAPEWHCL